jgi:signal transduction histidine kinase
VRSATIERDLHDGTQQRLVALELILRKTADGVPSGHQELRRKLERSAHELGDIADELREISRGIHPAIISRGGVALALNSLARRSCVPATCNVTLGRPLGEQIAVAVYYIVSEALTNTAKHAGASHVEIDMTADDSAVCVRIHDDGIGGADPARGSGLNRA